MLTVEALRQVRRIHIHASGGSEPRQRRVDLAGQDIGISLHAVNGFLRDAPPDAFVASGHGGKRVLFLVPSLDLIVCWNDSVIDDHDLSPGNPETRMNQAARLIAELPGKAP